MTMQKLVIRFVLGPMGKIVERISPRARKYGFLMGGLGMFLVFFLNGMGRAPSRYMVSFVAGCLCMGIMVFFALPENPRPLPFDRILSVLWFGAGLFMLLAGLRYNTDNLSDAIMFLIIWPVTWLVFNQRDIARIFRLLNTLCILSFLLFLWISMLFFPITEKRYPGLFKNVNNTAMYLSLVFCCLLVEIFRMRKAGIRFWGTLSLTGVAAAMIFYTNSRTGQLAALSTFLFGSVLYLYTRREDWKSRLLHNVLPVILSVLLFLPTTVYLFQGVSTAGKTVSQTLSGSSVETQTEKAPSGASGKAPSETSGKAPSEASGKAPSEASGKAPSEASGKAPSETSGKAPSEASGKTSSDFHGIEGFVEVNKKKNDTEGKTLDDVSTGRLSIWKEFAKHVRLFGVEEFSGYYVESQGQSFNTAHNTPLEYAVHSGLICAVCYFLFNLLAGLKSIRFALWNRMDGYELLPFVITIAFGIISMLASLKTPFYYMISMYYFFAQAPLMAAPTENLSTAKG